MSRALYGVISNTCEPDYVSDGWLFTLSSAQSSVDARRLETAKETRKGVVGDASETPVHHHPDRILTQYSVKL